MRTLGAGFAASLVVFSLAILLFPGASSQGAGPAGVGKIRAAHLPSVGQIARIYPVLEGGSRSIYSSRDIMLNNPRKKCGPIKVVATAASGKWASYSDRYGQSPYFDGYQDPGVFAYRFGQKGAREAFKAIRRTARRCFGTNRPGGGEIYRAKRVKVPKLGSQVFAWREFDRNRNVLTKWSYHRVLEIWIRKGKTLVNAQVQNERSTPDTRPAIRLARVALSRVR